MVAGDPGGRKEQQVSLAMQFFAQSVSSQRRASLRDPVADSEVDTPLAPFASIGTPAANGQRRDNFSVGEIEMLKKALDAKREGKIIPYAIAWLLGVPIPILLLIYVLHGCS
jgi:hypothetical protein